MICQHCQTTIDDDLIFCTNCGQRLFEPATETETIVQPRSGPNQPVVRKSPGRTVAIVVAVLLLIAGSGAASVFLYLRSNPAPVVSNSQSPTPKPSAKKPAATAKPSVNSNTATPSPTPEPEPDTETETVMDERIEIAAGEYYARPFEITEETIKIYGQIKVLDGDEIKGFVYPKDAFDEHFPDEIYKSFSFDAKPSTEFEQTLIAGKFVLVFVNDNANGVTVDGKVTLGK